MTTMIYVASVVLILAQTIGVRFWVIHVTQLSGCAAFNAFILWTLGLAVAAFCLAMWGVVVSIR